MGKFQDFDDGIKRGIRLANLKGTVGFHIYKLGEAGENYWNKRLENAKTDENRAYCVAQLEKCKMSKARKKEVIDNDPKIKELREKRKELKNKLKAIYMNPNLTIEQKKELQNQVNQAIDAVDMQLKQREDELISILHSKYESAVGLFEDSYVGKETPIGDLFGNLSWRKIKNGPEEKNNNRGSNGEKNSNGGKTQTNNPYSQEYAGGYSENSTPKTPKNPKDMSPEEIQDLIENALNIDDKITEMTETPEEKAARLERERIEAIETIKREIEDKEAEKLKIAADIETIKKGFEEPFTKMETFERARQLENIIQISNNTINNIDRVMKPKINGVIDNADDIIENLKKTGSRIKAINNLAEAEKNKDTDAINKAKEDLAKLLGKDPKDLQDTEKEREEALQNLKELKQKVMFDINDDGNIIPLSDETRDEMEISEFIEIIEKMKENKDDINKGLDEGRKNYEEYIKNAKAERETLTPVDEKEYNEIKVNSKLAFDAISILEDSDKKIDEEISKLAAKQKELEGTPEIEEVEEEKEDEKPDVMEGLHKLFDDKKITSPEVTDAMRSIQEALRMREDIEKRQTTEIEE